MVRDHLAKAKCFVPVVSKGIPKQFLPHASRAELIESLELDVDSIVTLVKDSLI